MYKVMLVDDEYLIRESLKKAIKWKELGTEIVGEGKNGKEALDLVKDLDPDIILTDISMPIMDGIELAKAIKKLYPHIKVIFISGYDDFAYAQQAIKIGVEDYILKPIKNENVEQCITQVIAQIEQEKMNSNEVMKLKIKIYQHEGIIRDAFLNYAIRGVTQVSREDVFQKLDAYGCNVLEEPFYVMVTTINDLQSMQSNKSQDAIELDLYCIINIQEEIFAREFNKALVFKSQANEVCAIVSAALKQEKPMSIEIIKEHQRLVALEISQAISKFLTFTVAIGIGHPYKGDDGLKKSFMEASAVLNIRNDAKGEDIYLSESLQNGNDKHVMVIDKAKNYIEDNISKDISLSEISTYVELSANYFCNLFKQKTGNNLLDYILSEKMEKARCYVMTTNLKIYEIAHLVGYNDSRYFCTVFKKFFHCNPSELRKES